MREKLYKLIFMIIIFFFLIPNSKALTGVVNVNDSLTLRSTPSTSGTMITKFYNATVLNILSTNAGSGNGCNNWYKVSYGQYTGYSCGDYIILNKENNSSNNTTE